MKIIRLVMETAKLAEMKKFYNEMLEMPMVREEETYFTVRAGKTLITFTESENAPYYHFALRTSLEKFDYFYDKLKVHHSLLKDEEGRTSMYWEGKQVYFYDPEGNVLEILERPNPYTTHSGPYYDVCEIGMPAGDVFKMAEFLGDIENVNPSESDMFAFYGDKMGNFVLVKDGRHWYPTERAATIHPLTVEIEGDHYKVLKHPKLPYTVKIKPVWKGSVPAVQMRIARPTDQLEEVIKFYEEGLGLKRIGEFWNHNGFDGVMFGLPELPYHLEFTRHEDGSPCPAPTKDNLLVFYIPDANAIETIVGRLNKLAYFEVEPENPYWKENSYTFEDPDGWRVVLFLSTGMA